MSASLPEVVFSAMSRPRRRAATAADEAVLAAGRPATLLHGARQLRLWRFGPKAVSARHVILAHGWESRAAHWGLFIQALVQAGMRVTVYDAPAHGESEGEDTHVIDMGEALLAVARLDAPDAVVGHSVGSAAALYALAQGLKVDASVHLCGPSSLQNVLRHAARSANMSDLEHEALRARFATHIGQPLSVMDLQNLQHGLRHPGLLVHDPDDAEVPFTESLVVRAVWPESVLEKAEGLGHRRILADPATVARVAGFLAMHAGARRAA